MTDYPHRLLPEAHFRFIRNEAFLRSSTFTRSFSGTKEEFLDKNGLPLAAKIDSPTDNVKDLSTSLLGTFLPKDNRLKIVGGRKGELTYAWKPGVTSPTITAQDFKRNDQVLNYFLSGQDLNDLKFKVTSTDGTVDACTASTLHTPTMANFWHVSVRWYDGKGIDVKTYREGSTSSIKKRRRAVLETGRNKLRRLVHWECGELRPVPLGIYT
ncbi:hypothetical protein [Neolewinella sp.]|uniref:hypothetical protein n=1 Tax=Neolewinella sp. TaxID=2993543 RepID=UPI003B52594A